MISGAVTGNLRTLGTSAWSPELKYSRIILEISFLEGIGFLLAKNQTTVGVWGCLGQTLGKRQSFKYECHLRNLKKLTIDTISKPFVAQITMAQCGSFLFLAFIYALMGLDSLLKYSLRALNFQICFYWWLFAP